MATETAVKIKVVLECVMWRDCVNDGLIVRIGLRVIDSICVIDIVTIVRIVHSSINK